MKILLVLLSCFFCLSASKSKSRNEPPSTIGKRQKENHILPKKIDDTIKNTITVYQGEDTLYNIVGRIEEVKGLIKKINSKSSNEKVSIIINKRPDRTFLYYWLQVGVDDGSRFQPVYNFYIIKRNLEIKYYDTSDDSIVSLKEWRRMRGW